MKATGITRRVDNLGRIAIPKDIRSQIGICVGDSFKFYLDKTEDGRPMICLIKYSTTFEDDLISLTDQITNDMNSFGEYELSDKFREAINEATKILKQFENRS